MSDNHWPEYYEGMKAFDRRKDPWGECPYNLNSVDSARHLQWMEGWEAAKQNDDDDDDGGKGPGGWPSTTGNPSGGGRQNA